MKRFNTLNQQIIKEACTGSVQESIAAYEQGAQRVELCSRLDLDGLTPSIQDTQELLSRCPNLQVCVMIRNTNESFYYTNQEIDQMVNQIEDFKRLCPGIEGFVFGSLNKSQNQIDVKSLKDLVEASRPYPVVFHKAIDVIPEGNLHHAITVLNSFKVDRVLTSGLAKTAIEGQKNIRSIMRDFNGIVVAAGKVTNTNLRQCMREIGANQYHGKLIVGALNTKHVNIVLKENSPRNSPRPTLTPQMQAEIDRVIEYEVQSRVEQAISGYKKQLKQEVKEQQRMWEAQAHGPAFAKGVTVKRRAASPGMRSTKSDLSAVPGAARRATSPMRYPRGYPGGDPRFAHGYGGYGGYGHPGAFGGLHHPGFAGGRYGDYHGYGHPGYGGNLSSYGSRYPFYGPSLGHVGKAFDHPGYVQNEFAQEEKKWKN